MDYAKKGYKIAGIALILALLTFSMGGGVTTNNYYNNTSCSNCTNFSDNTKLNKSTVPGEHLNMNSNNIYNTSIFQNTNSQLLVVDSLGTNSLIHLQALNNTIEITDTEKTFNNDINMGGKNITNCGNCTFSGIDNTKVNKSGDTMTGVLNMDVNSSSNGKQIFYANKSTVNENVMEYYNNGTLRTKLTKMGTQYWYVNTSDFTGVDTPRGLIAYVDPNSFIGIAFLNSTNGHRTDIRSTPAGIEFWVGTTGSAGSMTTDLTLQRNNTIHTSALTGVGNAYVCVYPNGTLFRGSPGC